MLYHYGILLLHFNDKRQSANHSNANNPTAFTVDYDKNSPILGLIKFNKYTQYSKRKLIPLGGIKLTNLGRLKFINSEGFAVLSEIKKKPVKIINRLF